jgi:hypothetical protein
MDILRGTGGAVLTWKFFRRSVGKFLVKGIKGAESVQVIGKMGNIKFKIFPVHPGQFAILEIESKKKEKLL